MSASAREPTMTVPAGYWRMTAADATFRCPYPQACLGNSSTSASAAVNGECAAGYTGLLCAEASASTDRYIDYFSREVESCDYQRDVLSAVLPAIAFAMLIALTWKWTGGLRSIDTQRFSSSRGVKEITRSSVQRRPRRQDEHIHSGGQDGNEYVGKSSRSAWTAFSSKSASVTSSSAAASAAAATAAVEEETKAMHNESEMAVCRSSFRADIELGTSPSRQCHRHNTRNIFEANDDFIPSPSESENGETIIANAAQSGSATASATVDIPVSIEKKVFVQNLLFLLVKLRLFLFALQICSSLPQTLQYSFPHYSTALLRIFGLVSLSSLSMIPFDCMFQALVPHVTIDSVMQLQSIMPVVVITLLLLSCAVGLECIHLRTKSSSPETAATEGLSSTNTADIENRLSRKEQYMRQRVRDRQTVQNKRLLLQRSVTLTVLIMSLTLPFVIHLVLAASVSCVNLSSTELHVNWFDVTVSCEGSRYQIALIWAAGAVLLYLIVFPLLGVVMLRTFRTEIQTVRYRAVDSRVTCDPAKSYANVFVIMFVGLNDSCLHWELIEVLFRVLFIAVLPLLSLPLSSLSTGVSVSAWTSIDSLDPQTRTLLAIVLSLSYLVALARWSPYRMQSDQSLAVLSTTILILVLILLLAMQLAMIDTTRMAVDILMCGLLIAIPVIFIAQVWSFFQYPLEELPNVQCRALVFPAARRLENMKGSDRARRVRSESRDRSIQSQRKPRSRTLSSLSEELATGASFPLSTTDSSRYESRSRKHSSRARGGRGDGVESRSRANTTDYDEIEDCLAARAAEQQCTDQTSEFMKLFQHFLLQQQQSQQQSQSQLASQSVADQWIAQRDSNDRCMKSLSLCRSVDSVDGSLAATIMDEESMPSPPCTPPRSTRLNGFHRVQSVGESGRPSCLRSPQSHLAMRSPSRKALLSSAMTNSAQHYTASSPVVYWKDSAMPASSAATHTATSMINAPVASPRLTFPLIYDEQTSFSNDVFPVPSDSMRLPVPLIVRMQGIDRDRDGVDAISSAYSLIDSHEGPVLSSLPIEVQLTARSAATTTSSLTAATHATVSREASLSAAEDDVDLTGLTFAAPQQLTESSLTRMSTPPPPLPLSLLQSRDLPHLLHHVVPFRSDCP